MYNERLTELSVHSLEKKKLRGILIAVNCLMEGCRKDQIRFFWMVYSDRTRGNRHKLESKFQLTKRRGRRGE